jgi:cytidylate kinase-like protein
MTVITLSASYGAGGSQVGPALAGRLDLSFVDRAIPSGVAERLAVPLHDAVEHDESVRTALDRLLLRLAPLGSMYGWTGAEAHGGDVPDEDAYRRATEQVLHEHAAGGRTIILGRGGAVVLAGHPGALHVRLDGPPGARLEQAMRLEHVDRETAERHMEQTDGARQAYVRHFYRADPRDADLYHLVIDSTAIDLGTCVELIATAAAARGSTAAG